MDEIIYILTNEAMPGYVKIGKTSTSLEQRIRELSSSTSVPLPFTCFYACTVKNAHFVERQLHDAFDNNRANPRREFFEIAPERVVAALKLAEIENVTPNKDFVESQEDQRALNLARTRRSRFNFEMADIPIGAELVFSRDENIKAKVVDNRNIEFNGEKTNLSAAAEKALGVSYGVGKCCFPIVHRGNYRNIIRISGSNIINPSATITTMKEKRASFYSDGHKLDGSWYLPPKGKENKSAPLLLICSGFLGLKDIHPARFARFFTELGYRGFSFDYRGFGKSEGVRGHVLLEEQIEDISNAISFVLPRLKESRKIVLIGWGMGGGLVLEAAHTMNASREIVGLMSLNGFYSGERVQQNVRGSRKWKQLQHWALKQRMRNVRYKNQQISPFDIYPLDPITQKYVDTELRKNKDFGGNVTLAFLGSLMRFAPECNLADLSLIPLFIAHGTKNLTHPPNEARALYKKYPGGKTLYWIKDAGHTEWMHDDHPTFLALTQKMHIWLKQR